LVNRKNKPNQTQFKPNKNPIKTQKCRWQYLNKVVGEIFSPYEARTSILTHKKVLYLRGNYDTQSLRGRIFKHFRGQNAEFNYDSEKKLRVFGLSCVIIIVSGTENI
jgi:hypothetical protein